MQAHSESAQTRADRRDLRRFVMELPVSVRVPGIPSEFETQTENISARGIFFVIDRRMTEGCRLEISMSFPPQITMSDPLRVRLIARVLRAEPRGFERTGVAAAIEEYEFLRDDFSVLDPALSERNFHVQLGGD